jgi:uncharacterized membrane protein ArfC
MNVNWWLMVLAFVLGLVITLAFTIGRVKREVPVSVGSASGATAAKLVDAKDDPTSTDETAAEADVAPAAVETPPAPHGPGSAAPGVDGSGPSGWTVKGNEESKLYHSPESPSYGITRAEVWFRDAETAEAAGFNRWDSGKSQRGKK